VGDHVTEHNTRAAAVFPAQLPRKFPAWGRLGAVTWTRWDARQLVRAVVVAAIALGLAWLVTAATDEGGIAWRERAGRTLPLTPLCAAVGAWVALAPVRARGEALALEALGRSPAQIAAAAAVGGALVALVAAMLLGAGGRAVDVAGFFPTATHAAAWTWDGAGFVDRVQGLRVGTDGAPQRFVVEAGTVLTGVPPFGRAAAAVATALAGLALPLLVAHASVVRARPLPVALAAGAALAASVVLFQAAAARLVPAWLGVLPPLVLLAVAVRRWRYRG
jgi:hypothetical protein